VSEQQQSRSQLSAQLLHWEQAVQRLADLNEMASPEGWSQLERQTGTVLRASIQQSIRDLCREGQKIRDGIGHMSTLDAARAVQELRRDYLRTETMLDFFADAINSRSSGRAGQLLRGLDRIAGEGMARILTPLGYSAPPVITYIDKGLGASILKAGLRLWDRRSINPVASIKVVRHNILTPTSVLHELGHQVAHITNWNEELKLALERGLPGELGRVWSSWATEIAADAIAFVYAGHASLAALRNVVDGGVSYVFRFMPGDPHPIGMARVLMVCQFAKSAFGKAGSRRIGNAAGDQPWTALEKSWIRKYPIDQAGRPVAQLVRRSIPELAKIADIVLERPFRAFGERSLTAIVDPQPVSPGALDRFEREAGPRAFDLPYVVKSDPIRLLALSGLRIATRAERGAEYYAKQHRALQVLGDQAEAA
jgi:hypothetical protein